VTDGWDGRGLPPVAGARIARAARGGVRTSLLAADGVAGLGAAGFDVVGEVLGAAVMQPSWMRFNGWVPISNPALGRAQGPVARAFVTYEPYRQVVRAGWQNALDRMRLEAAGLGADGVVAVRLTGTPLAEAERLGADGALMSGISLHVRELAPNGHTDHAAECLITGNAIARFRSAAEPLEATPAVILSDGRVPRWRRRGMTER
jgi:uncharacterized protein YbjQ (UPF0145 family)